MPLLVFGTTGQLAQALRHLAPDARYISRAEADFNDPETCASLISKIKPYAVINAVAYTAVDAAEDDEANAMRINADTPAALARACAHADIPFVHVSTDYVFDGGGALPFAPDHPTAPLGAYGRSKLAGEDAIRSAGGSHVILRTSWVVSATGRNFVKTMLDLGAKRHTLSIVADQIGGPTCAADIAQACLDIADQLARNAHKSGTYHFSGVPEVSWADFARAIFARARMDVMVSDIPAAQFPTKAARPQNSRLDNSATLDTFGIARPDWRQGLDAILDQLNTGQKQQHD